VPKHWSLQPEDPHGDEYRGNNEPPVVARPIQFAAEYQQPGEREKVQAPKESDGPKGAGDQNDDAGERAWWWHGAIQGDV
jgi:hypothetical protein